MSFILIVPVISSLIAGLLVNFLADVLPNTLKLSRPVCAHIDCRQPFNWLDYLFLKRCQKCNRTRSLRSYLIIILMLTTAVYLWKVPPGGIGFTGGLIIITYLITVAIVDLEHRIILKSLSIVGLIIGALTGIIMQGWSSSLIGGAAGFAIMGLFYLCGLLFTRLRSRRMGKRSIDNEEALGSGDVTLATILGLLLGWPLIWFCLLMGVFIAGIVSVIILAGLLISKRYGQKALMVFIPYGPPFILSAVLIVYFPHWMAYLAP